MLQKIKELFQQLPFFADFRFKLGRVLDYLSILGIVTLTITVVLYAIKHSNDLSNIFLILSKEKTSIEKQLAIRAMPDSALSKILQKNTLQVDLTSKSYIFVPCQPNC